jgi:predicted lipoprotein with Yx(FWY)xxD motif
MLRFLVIAALLISANEALAHGSEPAAAPPPPKPAGAPAKIASTKRGPILTNDKGMTLYTFDKDDSGNKSNCDAKCVEQWTPFSAPTDAQAIGDFTVITRNDGSKMWAYRYRPLYTSVSDKAPGDTNGTDAATLWKIARPAAF